MNLERNYKFENDISEEIIGNSNESQISAGELEKAEIIDKSAIDDEKEYMKLYFNDTEVPVIWESNQTVQELMEEAGKGDIVLYSGDKIVVFYGSNSWAYTRLGKMNIPEGDVTELLSNGGITLKIVIAK